MIKKVLVVGGRRTLDSLLINTLLSSSYSVTAFVSRNANVHLQHPNLKYLRGSLNIYKDVREAVVMQEVIIWTGGEMDVDEIIPGTQNILFAMKQEGIRRFICLSSIGTGSSARKVGILFYCSLILEGPARMSRLAGQEYLISQSALDFTIVQIGHLDKKNDIRKPLLAIRSSAIEGTLWRRPKISQLAVAEFVMRELRRSVWLHQTVCLLSRKYGASRVATV